MPLYEYRCKACDKVFEYIQSFSSRPKRKCEECSGKLEKLISRSGFVLKGTGWYETDFKGDSGKGEKASGSPSAIKSDEGSSSSSDSESKTTTKTTKKGGSSAKKKKD